MKPALISLFAGPGGMDEGFRQAGFETRLAYDNDPASIATFAHNHPWASAYLADLSETAADEIVLAWSQCDGGAPVGVIGGPPCQSFSVGNVHQKADDSRHLLPGHYARILKGLNSTFRLHFFIFENVPGLVTNAHIEKFKVFVQMFEDAGFRIFEHSLDAKDFGVPQVRRRIFVVGLNAAIYPQLNFEFPQRTVATPRTVRQAIADLPEPVRFSRGLRQEDIPLHPNHWCMAPRSVKFTNGMLREGDTRGRSFRVLSWDQPSQTVAYGHREVHIHPNCHRRLSVYEAMLLQGFPRKDYVFKGNLSDQIRLVSEAVPPPIANAIAQALRRHLALRPIQQRLSFGEAR